MKKIVVVFLMMLGYFSGMAQTAPAISFLTKDQTIDYGTISKKNDNGIRAIEFTNSGGAPLLITNVLSTPGFSIISKPSEAILPGKNGKIIIKYNMIAGPIRKTITIESNAQNIENGRIPIKIKGEVSVP